MTQQLTIHQSTATRASTHPQVMPKPRNKNCQTDYDKWIEHQIQEGIENFSKKFRTEVEEQISKLKKEFTDLSTEIEDLRRENDSLRNSKQIGENTIEQLQHEIEDLEDRNNHSTSRLHLQLQEKDTHIRLMMEKIDQLEQGTKMSNIKITGIIEEEEEDIKAKVVDLIRDQLKVYSIKLEDINEAGRMGKKNHTKTRDVIVKFNHSILRDTIYRKRKQLRRSDNPVYINEDLTQYRSQLFFEARKLRKKGKLFGAWTQGGNVMVKQKQNDIPTVVSNYNQLKSIIQDYSESDNDQEDESSYE